jgi:hypothetical protein
MTSANGHNVRPAGEPATLENGLGNVLLLRHKRTDDGAVHALQTPDDKGSPTNNPGKPKDYRQRVVPKKGKDETPPEGVETPDRRDGENETHTQGNEEYATDGDKEPAFHPHSRVQPSDEATQTSRFHPPSLLYDLPHIVPHLPRFVVFHKVKARKKRRHPGIAGVFRWSTLKG